MNKKEVIGIATLMGATIGAGILGLPYVTTKVGLVSMIIMTVILSIAVLFLNLYIGEITLRSKRRKELSGYVEEHWGKIGKSIMGVGVIIWIIGALTAYTLGAGEALHAIFPSVSAFNFSVVFYVLTAIALYFGLNLVSRSELVLGAIMLVLILVILSVGIFNISPENVPARTVSGSSLLLPIGVLLFALMAEVVIPELKPIIQDNKKLKRVIVIGTLIPAFVYLLFAVIIGSVIGSDLFESLPDNERVATIPLGLVIGPVMGIFANSFAVLSMATSFLALGLGLIWTIKYDYHVRRNWAWAVAVIAPAFFITSGKATFISAMDFAGSIAGGITGIILVLTLHRARKNSEIKNPAYVVKYTKIVTPFLIAVFAIAIIQEIVRLIV